MAIIVIRFGYKEEGVIIGWAALFCRFCQAVQPMAVYKIARKHAINDIGVGKFADYCRRMVCSFCTETIDVDLYNPLRISTSWRADADPLQLLIDETRPEIGQSPERHKRSASEVKAVLLRSDEWARFAFNNEGNRGGLAGVVGLVVLIIGCIGGYLLSPAAQPNAPQHAPNYSIAIGLPFTIAVMSSWYFFWQYWGVRKLLAARLTAAAHLHNIKKAQYHHKGLS